MTNSTVTDTPVVVITPDQLLQHWQGHRRSTRRFIEAFPEEHFASFSIGGMRPFSALTQEMIGMVVPTLRGLISWEWTFSQTAPATTRADMLTRWDETTGELDRMWPEIPPHRFQEVQTAFGQWTMPGYRLVFYLIDNEIHHRAQGSVYLRALNLEPPFFYDSI